MSTRCQIKMKNSEFNIYIYKHSDGYPEDVIPRLKAVVDIFIQQNRLDDESYFLAQCVRHMAMQDYKREQQDPWYIKNPERSSEYNYLGWGLDCIRHDDIEYLYEVDTKGTIYINGKKLQPKKSKTKETTK